MEEIYIKDLFHFYLKKLHILFICIIFALLIGIGYISFLQKPVYSSSALITLKKENTDLPIAQVDIVLNQKLVSAYREIVKSRRVLSRVNAELKHSYSNQELASMIKAEQISGTEIIKIRVSSDNRKISYNITNKVVEIFIEEINNIYGYSNIEIIDTPVISDASFNSQKLNSMVFATGGGLIIGVAVVFIMFYFSDSPKSTTVKSKMTTARKPKKRGVK